MVLLKIMMILFLLISSILILLNYLLSKKKINDREKNSPFECGFDPLSTSRLPFSIHFYLISIIFLIFDVEIIILIPLINSFLFNKMIWMETSMYIIMTLMFGLYIEWNDGALKWLK